MWTPVSFLWPYERCVRQSDADADGSDHAELEPTAQPDAGGWWTCHRETRAGDLILLYRTRLKMDLAYLIQAASDAFPIGDNPSAREHGWDYGCAFQVLLKLQPTITLAQLRSDPAMAKWGALRANFQGAVHAVPDEVWSALIARIDAQRPARVGRSMKQVATAGAERITTEKDLQKRLCGNPAMLARVGIDIEKLDMEVYCTGHGGRIDLLGFDRKGRQTVVIELKVVRAGKCTFGQICGYMGWAAAQRGYRKPIRGVVVADGFDEPFKFAATTNPAVRMVTLADIGFKLGK